LEPRSDVADEEVAHARRDAAVDERRDLLRPSEFVEREGILGKEGDVDGVLAAFEDSFQRPEAEEAGHGADDEIRLRDDTANGVVERDVDSLAGNPIAGAKSLEAAFVSVSDEDVEALVLCQIDRHGAPDSSGAQDDDIHALPPSV
jgi:hypothetical protein